MFSVSENAGHVTGWNKDDFEKLAHTRATELVFTFGERHGSEGDEHFTLAYMERVVLLQKVKRVLDGFVAAHRIGRLGPQYFGRSSQYVSCCWRLRLEVDGLFFSLGRSRRQLRVRFDRVVCALAAARLGARGGCFFRVLLVW
jgi:hypothetical protein